MRTLTHSVAVLALCLGTGILAGQDPKSDEKRNDDKPISDAEFVIKAASGGMFEVESSRIAKENAQADEVKKFAERMITDHEKANKELKEVAQKANLGIPLKMLDHHTRMLDQVKNAKGSELDKTYMETQVTAHEEAVALFSNAAKNAKDAGLKSFAEKALPTLKDHLEDAKKHGKNDKDK